MFELAGENELDLKALRTRLGRVSDREVLRFGRAARYMCSAFANHGKPPWREFEIQLREAENEWRHRQRASLR